MTVKELMSILKYAHPDRVIAIYDGTKTIDLPSYNDGGLSYDEVEGKRVYLNLAPCDYQKDKDLSFFLRVAQVRKILDCIPYVVSFDTKYDSLRKKQIKSRDIQEYIVQISKKHDKATCEVKFEYNADEIIVTCDDESRSFKNTENEFIDRGAHQIITWLNRIFKQKRKAYEQS